MDTEQLRKEVEEIDWYHSIPLGDGIVTPGAHPSQSRLDWVQLPNDLRGKSVLDIGAWDGFYSFEAERRGAERVLAVDSYSWDGSGWGSKDGFELARRALNSRVEDRQIDVLDISPETVGEFDVVLFLDVLYHMRHPLLALERVASVTRELLILSTVVDMRFTRRPAAAFYPGTELNDDETNWWGPNTAAVKAMLAATGFRDARTPRPRTRAGGLGSQDRGAGRLARSWLSFGRGARRPPGRILIHAEK